MNIDTQPIADCTGPRAVAPHHAADETDFGPRLSGQIGAGCRRATAAGSPFLIGVLRGEGIGPEIIECALEVLRAVGEADDASFRIEFGGDIGRVSEKQCGRALSDDVVGFCRAIFDRGGVILSGPGGGRYVYDLRQRFDLFCKLSPIRPPAELAGAGRMAAGHAAGTDILVVRECASGLYQGKWELESRPGEPRRGVHTFSYTESDVRRVVGAAARMARERRGRITVIYKEAGAPTISELWRDCATAIAAEVGVECNFLDIDYSAYRMLQHPREFDVIVAPNLFGDILSDVGGVLLGSRALTYGGNYGADGSAFYQTNHGSAYDLAGTDRSNPVGQLFSLALLLHESFGLSGPARRIERAVRAVWAAGWRTEDLAEAGGRVVGTRRFAQLVAAAILDRSRRVA